MRVLHFLHIGKTGGTAIKHALSGINLETEDWKIILHSHQTSLEHIPPGESVFFLLRNPISRFVSGFYSRQRQGLPAYDSPWSRKEKVAFSIFDKPEELATALTSADIHRRLAAHGAMKSIRHVRDSYWKWFGCESYFQKRIDDIFFVGRQESLTLDFECLKTLLGLDPSIKLPEDDLNAHRNPAQCDYKLSATAVDNLRTWYEQDFHFIQICRHLQSQISDRGALHG